MRHIDPDSAHKKPLIDPPTINDVLEIKVRGPWKTKSKAELNVLFALSHNKVEEYLEYDKNELANIPEDIRGLRSYFVGGLQKGSIGGMEFHRIRKELLFGLEGIVDVKIEDVYGNTRRCRVDAKNGFYIPPFILHTYKTRKDNSRLLVIANTLFNPEDPRTHDTYSKETFVRLQSWYM